MKQHTIYGVLTVFLLAMTLILTELVTGGAIFQSEPTLSPNLGDVLEYAQDFTGSNADWTPVIQKFDGVEMVLVPAGCFETSVENDESGERPVSKVCFEEPFWIDRTEVTNGQFAAFNGNGYTAWRKGEWSDEDRPREQITWEDAATFCESRGVRLPTEAEWEYAARGPDGWVYPWGNEWDENRVIGSRSLAEGTAPVGSKSTGASWVGALDMSGNVWEWVADLYSPNYWTVIDGAVNPTGPTLGHNHVLRGGSWSDGIPAFFSATLRFNAGPPTDVFSVIGFRCARSVNTDIPPLVMTPDPTKPMPLDPEMVPLPAGAHNAD